MFSSCAAVGNGINAKFDSGYFTEDGSYVLNCKGISNLAAACKTNLTDMDSVTSLTLKYIDNTNIKGISEFKNLRDLTIINSDLAEKDISFLSENIKSLVLCWCKNIDYTQIPHTISSFSLHYSEDIDLDAVSEMDNITSLSMTDSNIAYQSKLSLLKQLTSLEVIGNMGSDEMLTMSFISDLTNLTALRIYDLYCAKFDAVSNLKQLEELSFTNSRNVSYEALSALTKLKILDTTEHSLYDHVINSCDVFSYVNKYHMDEDKY